jgi:hypothetical protein
LYFFLHGAETCSGRGARNINSCILMDSILINDWIPFQTHYISEHLAWHGNRTRPLDL